MVQQSYPNSTFEMEVGRTSSFEVTVNGKLVHSKLAGQGFVTDFQKLQAEVSKLTGGQQ